MPYARLVRETSVHRALEAIGNDVRRARITVGLSQDTLAAMCDIAQSTISRIERGAAPGAGLERLSRIMVALDMRSLGDFR